VEKLTTPSKEKMLERDQKFEELTARRSRMEELLTIADELKEVAKEITLRAQERASERAHVTDLEENREKSDAALDRIEENASRRRDEKLEPTLEHAEKLKQRMVDIFDETFSDREKSVANLREIIEKARGKSSANLLASGNLRAQKQAFDDLTFYSNLNERLSKIFGKSDAFRAEWNSVKDSIAFNARQRHAAKSLRFVAFSNRDGQNVKADALFERLERTGNQLRINNELKSQLRTAAPSTVPPVTVEAGNNRNLGLFASVRRLFVPHSNLKRMYQPQAYNRRHFKPHSSIREIHLIIKQENFRSILSGMLIDKALHADTLIKKTEAFNTHQIQQQEEPSFF